MNKQSRKMPFPFPIYNKIRNLFRKIRKKVSETISSYDVITIDPFLYTNTARKKKIILLTILENGFCFWSRIEISVSYQNVCGVLILFVFWWVQECKCLIRGVRKPYFDFYLLNGKHSNISLYLMDVRILFSLYFCGFFSRLYSANLI